MKRLCATHKEALGYTPLSQPLSLAPIERPVEARLMPRPMGMLMQSQVGCLFITV